LIGSGVFAAVLAAGGCAVDRKPYAADPLLGRGRGVWGNVVSARPAESIPGPEPAAPKPPPGPLVGSPPATFDVAGVVTSP
jgi:hypothetical protein